MAILLGIFEEGLIYAIMALGVYITYKILDFPDLSVDGTFPLGAALTAGLIVKGVSPVWALPISFFAGVLAGCETGVLQVNDSPLLRKLKDRRNEGKPSVPVPGYDL